MTRRIRIVIRGAVQGVGFRPFVYRLAREMGLAGWVRNTAQGVFIEAEKDSRTLERFLLRLERELPPRASIQSLEFSFLDPLDFDSFEIRPSEPSGEAEVLVLPDIATCEDCLREILDPSDRRYRYPFTNCTNCGPRFSIIEGLPYDRANTSMKSFMMCAECRREYLDPLDRRFHAQPTACPACGPRLQLWDGDGNELSPEHEALRAAAQSVRSGRILALKGLGGFQLLVDARNAGAVARLRERKHREEKPFALMFPSLAGVRACCEVSDLEERLLTSPESPIVLLRRRHGDAGDSCGIAPEVAPGNPFLGIMLPYTPLHHLLLRELPIPVVATSGNLSDEPICYDEGEALQKLGDIADLFLVHDRPIVRHVDDSIVRVILGRELVLRRARGYAPLPLQARHALPEMLAVGGHLKNTVAVTRGENIFLSQHIGDLDNAESERAFREVMGSLQRIYRTRPALVVADMHPDYLSSRIAGSLGMQVRRVQHHHAHVAACMMENGLDGRVLGVAWDGTGYGTDGTVWGGEFLLTDDRSCRRVAAFRKFRLPGSEQAVREPRRAALGLLHEIFAGGLFDMEGLAPLTDFDSRELAILRRMLERGIHSPWTSSAGRIFDAAAAILGLRQRATYEGQAAMELEFAATCASGDRRRYEFRILRHEVQREPATAQEPNTLLMADWEPLIRDMLEDVRSGVPAGTIAAGLHEALARIIVAVAREIGEQRVVLTGGCFQNRILTELAVRGLEEAGFRPYWHQRIPPNDGGIALGQIAAACRDPGKE